MTKNLQNEEERLQFCIGRFDHLFDSIHNKTNVYLGIIVFITGGLITAAPSIVKENDSCIVLVSLVTLVSLGLIIILLLLLINTPYLSSRKDKSIYYFGSISNHTLKSYIDTSENYSTKDNLTDLRNQVHLLSVGLSKKYKRLRTVSIFLIVECALLVPAFIIFILKIK